MAKKAVDRLGADSDPLDIIDSYQDAIHNAIAMKRPDRNVIGANGAVYYDQEYQRIFLWNRAQGQTEGIDGTESLVWSNRYRITSNYLSEASKLADNLLTNTQTFQQITDTLNANKYDRTGENYPPEKQLVAREDLHRLTAMSFLKLWATNNINEFIQSTNTHQNNLDKDVYYEVNIPLGDHGFILKVGLVRIATTRTSNRIRITYRQPFSQMCLGVLLQPIVSEEKANSITIQDNTLMQPLTYFNITLPRGSAIGGFGFYYFAIGK